MKPAAPASRWAGKAPLLINFVLFQAGWFACILAAAHGRPWLGTLAVAAFVAWHLQQAAAPAREALLIALTLAAGLALDGALLAAGLMGYTSGQYHPALPPHWMSALWALLGTTLNVSMGWLKRRALLAALMGAVAGPLSYVAGVRLGAAHFVDADRALLLLAIGWALAMPALMALAERLDGIRRP